MLDGNGTPFAASTVPPFTTSVEADGSAPADPRRSVPSATTVSPV